MPPKKTSGARRTRDEADSDKSLREQDQLIITNAKAERPFTLSRFFKEKLNDGLGKLLEPDWSEFKGKLSARGPNDKPWFIQVASEEVGSEPAPGQFEGQGQVYDVQFVGVAEAESNDTLSPSTFIIREHRANADIEDCQPEKIRSLKNHNFEWLEIVQDDGKTSTNTFLLVTASERQQLLGKVQSFGFGAAPSTTTTTTDAAPATASTTSSETPATTSASNNNTGFGGASWGNNTNSNTSTENNNNSGFAAGFGAGFGSSSSNNNNSGFAAGFGSSNNNNNNNFAAGFGGTASNTTTNNNSFASGFGAAPSTTAATNNSSFASGFGAAAPAPAATSQDSAPSTKKEEAPAATLPTASSGVPRDAKDVQFQLFDKASLKDMQAITTAGSKIVLTDVPLSNGKKWKKLKMENDLHDKVAQAAQAAVDKQFAKENDDMKELAEWLDECPIADPKVIEPLITVRERALKMFKGENEKEYEALAAHKKELEEALKQVVEERKAEIKLEKEILEEVSADLKGGRVLSRDKWKIYKFHPKNDVVKFRPHNKFRALGSADECYPTAFDPRKARQANAFFKQD